jgi:hypothetical protein
VVISQFRNRSFNLYSAYRRRSNRVIPFLLIQFLFQVPRLAPQAAKDNVKLGEQVRRSSVLFGSKPALALLDQAR